MARLDFPEAVGQTSLVSRICKELGLAGTTRPVKLERIVLYILQWVVARL